MIHGQGDLDLSRRERRERERDRERLYHLMTLLARQRMCHSRIYSHAKECVTLGSTRTPKSVLISDLLARQRVCHFSRMVYSHAEKYASFSLLEYLPSVSNPLQDACMRHKTGYFDLFWHFFGLELATSELLVR